MKIVAGPSSVNLAEKVADLLKIEKIPVSFKTFPDGETYVRIDGETEQDQVVVIHTISPPQDTKLIQLFFYG